MSETPKNKRIFKSPQLLNIITGKIPVVNKLNLPANHQADDRNTPPDLNPPAQAAGGLLKRSSPDLRWTPQLPTSLPETSSPPTYPTYSGADSIFQAPPVYGVPGRENIPEPDRSYIRVNRGMDENAALFPPVLQSVPLAGISSPLASSPLRSAPPSKYLLKRQWQKLTRKTQIILIVVLMSILAPLVPVTGYGINAYFLYSHARGGIHHLLKVKDIFVGLKAHPTGFLDATKLEAARQEFIAAKDDFQQLNNMLNNGVLLKSIATMLPQYSTEIASGQSLSKIGLDIADIGQELVATGLLLAPSFRGTMLTDTTKQLIAPTMLDLVRKTIVYLLPLLKDIQAQTRTLSLDFLPISADQLNQLKVLIQAIPAATTDLALLPDMMSAVSWILGVDAPRTLLIQTMDRAELRPTGGFTGQFGELQINAGRVAPFSLKNIGPLEENNPDSVVNGQYAPEAYRSWWPIPNWGLRDSNLSADFPTSAQIAIKAYQFEFNKQIDGVVLFSPALIENMLAIMGPIQIPAYNETITAQNLEERLHYYQLDNNGIRKEELVEHVEDPQQARKLFTAAVSRIMIDNLRHAPPDELIGIAREMLHDLRTKDLQIYVTNQQIESLLEKHGFAAEMDRSTTHDGLYIVQANVSASKASQYVRTVVNDKVTLDAKGGATHVMQLRLVYNQVGPVYGLDTYRDYVRIYVPPTSKFLWGDGFDSGKPLCGVGYWKCPRYDPYGNGDLICPAGQYEPGAATSMLNDPYYGFNHPLDEVGPPTNFVSDEPGRKMFGGWLVVPKNCTLTTTISWYVPPMGTNPYALLFQRQSSTYPELDLSILPAPGNCQKLQTAGMHFYGILNGIDTLFSLAPLKAGATCYPDSRI